jgi:hypothetical protein
MKRLDSVRARKQRAQVLFEICKLPEIDELLSVVAVEIALDFVREQTTDIERPLPCPDSRWQTSCALNASSSS